MAMLFVVAVALLVVSVTAVAAAAVLALVPLQSVSSGELGSAQSIDATVYGSEGLGSERSEP